MQFKSSTGGALAALAAALALTAVPASAREADRHNNHGWQQRSDNEGQRTQRWGGRDQPTARPDRAAPQAQTPRTYEPQARGELQRSYRPEAPQRGWNRPDRPQQADAPQRGWTRPDRPQQVEPQQRSWAQRGGWSDPGQRQEQTQRWGGDRQTERNSTYVDRRRDATYGTTGSNWRDRDNNWRDNDWRDRRSGDRDWRDGNRDWRNGDRDGRRWDRTWRNNNRYDWQRYRTTNRYVFNVGRYYAPYRNYSYRRLFVGFSLSPLFYSDRYWISDPWQYRLPEAYGPYRWVRYYDDALLVDIYSGEVVDVIYDFFW